MVRIGPGDRNTADVDDRADDAHSGRVRLRHPHPDSARARRTHRAAALDRASHPRPDDPAALARAHTRRLPAGSAGARTRRARGRAERTARGGGATALRTQSAHRAGRPPRGAGRARGLVPRSFGWQGRGGHPDPRRGQAARAFHGGRQGAAGHAGARHRGSLTARQRRGADRAHDRRPSRTAPRTRPHPQSSGRGRRHRGIAPGRRLRGGADPRP